MNYVVKFQSLVAVSTVLCSVLVLQACGDNSQKTVQPTGQVQPAAQPVLTAQINISPQFESPQGWGPGFPKAKVDGKGVVVGPGGENPNVFAQQFPAKAGDQFKLIARASSVDKPLAKGRFQINWLSQESKFISTSISTFDVTPEEKTFEYFVTAPANTGAGILYVVPEGQGDVVRYTEMRVLGKEKGQAK